MLGLATIANFGAVLVGLWAISSFSKGADRVALLNLWATWGVLLGMVGQVGLLSGVLDHKEWRAPRNSAWAGGVTLLVGVALLPVRSTLFAAHESWVAVAAIMGGALYILGRQRGALSLRQRGASALVVTSLENVVRAVLLSSVLIAGRPSLGSIAIAGPLLISFAAFDRLIATRPNLAVAPVDRPAVDGPRSIAVSLLAGVPAALAYAVVPLLTLFGNTANIDRIAFAATILRGPLIIGGFLAPWFLERSPELKASWRNRLAATATIAVALQIGGAFMFARVSGIGNDGLASLLLQSVAASTAAAAAYLLVMLSPKRITAQTATAAGVLALVTAVVTLWLVSAEPSGLSFIGVGLASLAIIFTVNYASAPTRPEPTASPHRIEAAKGSIHKDAA